MSMKLTSVQECALAKAISGSEFKDASSEITPGKHDFCFTVRVRGSLKKSEDYTRLCEPRVDWKRLAYKALSKLNDATLRSVLIGHRSVTDEEIRQFDERVRPLNSSIGEKVEVECIGAVRADVFVRRVTDRPAGLAGSRKYTAKKQHVPTNA